MSKFKVGDRVAVYHGVFHNRAHGRVTGLYQSGEVSVLLDNNVQATVWPQQCRRLVKRERRSVWISTQAMKDVQGGTNPDWGRIVVFYENPRLDDPSVIEFREVKPLKKGTK